MLRTAVASVFACATIGLGVAVAATDEPPPAQAPLAPAGWAQTKGDPIEPLNRKLFWLHKKLDKFILRPVARTYHKLTPRPIRAGLRNALDNLGEPVTFVNDVLQLKPKRARDTVVRFAVNTTVGVGGVFDVASKMHVPIHYEDFGQTLGRYGTPTGPYLFVPVMGPTTLRDGFGRIIDYNVNPLSLKELDVSNEARAAIVGVSAIDSRATLDPTLTEMERTATDEYATVRSAYWQNRISQIADGVTLIEDLPDFDPLPADGQAPATPQPAMGPPQSPPHTQDDTSAPEAASQDPARP